MLSLILSFLNILVSYWFFANFSYNAQLFHNNTSITGPLHLKRQIFKYFLLYAIIPYSIKNISRKMYATVKLNIYGGA